MSQPVSPALRPVAGDGVLACEGGLVLLCATPERHPALVTRLLDLHAEVAAHGGDGGALADRVAAALTTGDEPGELGVVTFGPAPDGGVTVAVFGHAWADVSTVNGDQRLALRRSRTGVRSVLPGRLLSIRAALGDVAEREPQRWGSLRSGSVQAAGLLFVAADAAGGVPRPAAALATEPPSAPAIEPPTAPATEPPAAAVPPRSVAPQEAPATADMPAAGGSGSSTFGSPGAPAPEAQPFSSVVLVAGRTAAPQAPERAPLPLATAAAPDHRVEVLGVYCKNGHFDDPSARYCAICGIAMSQQTLTPRPGPRPPLGVLVLDDGAIFQLDADYVIGRSPSRDPDVVAASARALRMDDTEGTLSRVHARVHLDGWQVTVVDLASANGTGVRLPREQQWRQLIPRVHVAIPPGTEIAFGRRSLRYESHRNT